MNSMPFCKAWWFMWKHMGPGPWACAHAPWAQGRRHVVGCRGLGQWAPMCFHINGYAGHNRPTEDFTQKLYVVDNGWRISCLCSHRGILSESGILYFLTESRDLGRTLCGSDLRTSHVFELHSNHTKKSKALFHTNKLDQQTLPISAKSTHLSEVYR